VTVGRRLDRDFVILERCLSRHGSMMMAGPWESSVTVTRASQHIGSLQTTVVAK
jgi:hypothetical protein